MKGLINSKNNENECFLWCHIRHLNPSKIHPKRIIKVDKNMVNDLDYEGIKFPVSKKEFGKIEKKNNICINAFCYRNNSVYPVDVSNRKFKDCMDLLLITDENKSHYTYIKGFTRFMCNKAKCKNKTNFYRYCVQYFSSEKVLVEHGKACLKINGKQIVNLKRGSIKFRNQFKQIAMPFKIYGEFECNLKRVTGSDGKNNASYTEKYQAHIPCIFAYKAVCVDDKLSKSVVLYRGKMKPMNLLKQLLKSIIIAGE